MTINEKILELGSLRLKYLQKYNDSESALDLEALVFAFGVDETISILKESNGRKILVTADPKILDAVTYSFEGK